MSAPQKNPPTTTKTITEDQPAPPVAGPTATDFQALVGTKQYVRTQQGSMTHLFTSVVLSQTPQRVVVDQFLVAQLEAGKLYISED